MAERARELGLSDDSWDEEYVLARMKSCVEYTMDFNLDPDHSLDLSGTPRPTPRGPEHRYIGDDEEGQGADGPQ